MEPKYQYREKFIAFIDIIGFKDLIDNTGEEIIERVVNTIEESLDAYKERFPDESSGPDTDLMGYQILKFKPEYYLMSDSIILTMDVRENNLFRLLFGVTTIQKKFIENNLFVRGAVVKGKIFETTASDGASSIVFGPGGIAAYKMESTDALYPRVVVSDTVLGCLKEKYLYPRVESDIGKHIFQNITLKDSNGITFLDYLTPQFPTVLFPKGDLKFIQTHKNAILKKLAASETLVPQKKRYKSRTKFLLLAEYHDYILHEWKNALKNYDKLPGYQKLSIGTRVKGAKFFRRPF